MDEREVAVLVERGRQGNRRLFERLLQHHELRVRGGQHTLEMLKKQLQQVMEQVGCERVADLPAHLIRESVPV